MGLAEVRRDGEQCLSLDDDNIILYLNGNGPTGGTGFIVNNAPKKKIISFKQYTHRISVIIWKLKEGMGRIKIIQVYAPTSTSTDEEIEELYADLEDALEKDSCRYNIIMGDMNAKIGKNRGEKCVGKYGFGERNERGERLVEFVDGKNMYLMNSFFQKNETRKWTWLSPDGETKNEIDFFIIDKKSIVQDVDIEDDVNVGSDHRPIKMCIKIEEKRKLFHKKVRPRLSTEMLKMKAFEEKLEEKLALGMNTECLDMENISSKLTEIIKITSDTLNDREENRRHPIPREISKLLERRRRLKTFARDRIEFTEISKLIRRKWKEWTALKKTKELEETIKSRGSIKQTTRRQQLGTNIMISMKNENGEEEREVEGILRIICNFYEKLYSMDGPETGTSAECVRRNEQPDEAAQTESCPSILESEIVRVLNKLKDGKAGGPDRITNEELKAGGRAVVNILVRLFNICLKNKRVPVLWLKANLILLYKKGDRKEVKNYRPISLLCAIYKVFIAVITYRIEKYLDAATQNEQTGFKRNFSTLDNILVLLELIRKSKEYNFQMVLLFIDFEKAFDSVATNSIMSTLASLGIEDDYLQIFKYIYENMKLECSVRGESKEISVRRGLRQGDIPSAKIFNAVLETAFKNLEWQDKGININGKRLNCLKFADDIVLIGRSAKEVEHMLEELLEETKQIGLRVNFEKSKVMNFNCQTDGSLHLNQERIIENVNSFIYLGQRIGKDGQWGEITRRVALGWSMFKRFNHLFRSTVAMENKRRLFQMCIIPVMLYGCETWTLTEKIIKKMRTSMRAMQRIMLGVTRRDRKTKIWIAKEAMVEDIGRLIIERKWNWAGHIARTKDNRWTKEIIDWYPRTLKRSRGRPTNRWDEEFRRICGGATWQRVAQERTEWERMKTVYGGVWLYKD
jgi:hypothetical protein